MAGRSTSDLEGVIKRVLALRPSLTREAVERLIDEERAKSSGLLTREAAAHLVASNLGLSGAGERIEARLRIGDLTSGLGDVSLTGRVVHIFPARRFTRQDGREGKVLRLVLGDATGSVQVACWDEKADHVSASRLTPGKIVRVLHGYARERRGEVEVHVGSRGQIYQEPLDATEGDFPPAESFFKTPGEVHGEGSVNLIGVVVGAHPASSFTRRDGSVGRVARLLLEEGGGQINLVLWDRRVDELGGLQPGTRLRLVGGSARRRIDGRPEVHISEATAVEVLEVGAKPSAPASPWTKVADLRAGVSGVNVVARVSKTGGVREFTRRDGSGGRVASVLLRDETGSVGLSLWDAEVELLKGLEVGMTVAVENGYTRERQGATVLSLGQNGRLTLNPRDVEVAPLEAQQSPTEIQALREGQMNVTVRGRVLDYPEVRDVETARGTARVASFRIDDETGEARVSVWRDLVEEVEGLAPGTIVRIENCAVKPPYDGLIQLSSGPFTSIAVEKG